MDFENEIQKILTYLTPTKIKEVVDSTNSQCLWFNPGVYEQYGVYELLLIFISLFVKICMWSWFYEYSWIRSNIKWW